MSGFDLVLSERGRKFALVKKDIDTGVELPFTEEDVTLLYEAEKNRLRLLGVL